MGLKSSYTLKNGVDLKLREGEQTDAASSLSFVEKVSAQSKFLTFGPGEFGQSIAEQEKTILDKKTRVNELFLLAFIDETIVSQMTVNSSQRLRIRHAVEFGLSVDKAYWGIGVGNAMLDYLIHWAVQSPLVRKINLQVLSTNTNAIKLYEKFGFALEGKKLRDNYQDGEFLDVFLMGKLID